MPYAVSDRKSIPVNIYYEDIGSSTNPVLVMQHGDGNDSQDWKALGYVEKLSPHFRLILIDYLGYGRSDKAYDPNAYSMPLLAHDTIAVLKHLKIDGNAIFFGGSMGGRVGYELAITPEYASFFNCFIINGMGPSKLDVVTSFAQWTKEGGMEKLVTNMQEFMASPFPNEVRATFLRNDPHSYYAANINPWPSVTEKLKLIDKPVQLICGGCATELSDMEAACKLISQAEMHVVPELDHAQTYWYSDAVVPLMMDFLGKVLEQEFKPSSMSFSF